MEKILCPFAKDEGGRIECAKDACALLMTRKIPGAKDPEGLCAIATIAEELSIIE